MFSARDDLVPTGLPTPQEAAALAAAGITTTAGLLDHLPRRHEDRRTFERFPNQPTDRPVCVRGTVIDARRRSFGQRKGFFEALLIDGGEGAFGTGKLTCRWFNMPYIHRIIAAGQELVVHGRVKESAGRLLVDHPDFEVLDDDGEGESIHVGRIVPVYRNISGLSQRRLRELIHLLLRQTDPASLEPLRLDQPGQPRIDLLRGVHTPETPDQPAAVMRVLALEEFFAMQLNAAWRRARHRSLAGRVLGKRTALLTAFYRSLPFDLTDAQKRSIREIIADMRDPAPMNRLLQGDVGSGKTFVAMAAMLLAADSGCQSALMAPTQILAEQHFLTFRRWLEPLGLRIALRTADRTEETALELAGEPQVFIGTHALLYQEAAFRDLGLVVIDEQHKFGVAQRAALIGRGTVPDVLVMTATPIPRTLAMAVYGDLDVSLLDGKPPGRGRVVTAVRTGAKQRDVTEFVKTHLAAGRQAYLVYPLVEESDSLKAESATEAFAKWGKRLAGHEVGLLHGRLRPEEKERVMDRFRRGEIHALVSTTVIEVGVDVPNATLMILHHAERFGLSQLHQLRGRIGRGGHKGYCILLTDAGNEEALEKLGVLERSADGFEIAEEDLRLRGPGDILGTLQSGVARFRFASFLADAGLLREARERADRALAEDPGLTGRHHRLRGLIREEPDPATGESAGFPAA